MSCANETAHHKIVFSRRDRIRDKPGGPITPSKFSSFPTAGRGHRQNARTSPSQSRDVLYELGSGDGRIVIRAAQEYGIRAVGIEMDRLLLDQARRDAKSAGVTHLVEFRSEDTLSKRISRKPP
jgi:tRNA G46 methylase TrmB